jgi:hypothetical protein
LKTSGRGRLACHVDGTADLVAVGTSFIGARPIGDYVEVLPGGKSGWFAKLFLEAA